MSSVFQSKMPPGSELGNDTQMTDHQVRVRFWEYFESRATADEVQILRRVMSKLRWVTREPGDPGGEMVDAFFEYLSNKSEPD